ncbi:MAG: lysophospholipid acyltransferase family protein [Pseudomonadales bacterium]|nr:lysophospholipid acyltransferase family protein [Pseudomonadales bacterium]
MIPSLAAPRKTARHRVAWQAEAMLLRAFWCLSRGLSPVRAARMGSGLFRWLGPRLGKQRFVRANLQLAFPELDADALTTRAGEIWANFGSVLAEYPHMRQWRQLVTELEIAPQSRSILEAREPAVYVAAHIANWELAVAAVSGLGVPLSVVYAPQGNPLVNELIQARRQSFTDCRFVGKKNCVRSLLTDLRDGRSVGMLPDQRADVGEFLPFFGKPAQTSISPAWLALKLGRPLIPVQIERLGAARYVVRIHEPLLPQGRYGARAEALQLTAELNALFESWVRGSPGQWLCMRRRWPGSIRRKPLVMARSTREPVAVDPGLVESHRKCA